jgi:hypothetical protein
MFMNDITLKEKITEIENKINNSYDQLERALLSDELTKLRSQMNKKSAKKGVSVKTIIDAPIIADRKEVRDGVGGIRPNRDNSFSLRIN